MLLIGVVVGKLLAGRTNINVLLSHIAEVLFAKATSRLNAGGHRLRERYYDAGLVAGEYFRSAVVAAIGNGFGVITHRRGLRLGQEHDVHTILRHIDTAKREHCHLRVPSLLMRARARATVRVWKKRPELQAHSRTGIRSGCGLPVVTGD